MDWPVAAALLVCGLATFLLSVALNAMPSAGHALDRNDPSVVSHVHLLWGRSLCHAAPCRASSWRGT